MFFRQIYNDQLAQASYFIACPATGEALVVDPTREIERYIDLAEREGLRITAITETHIHADFISGARELAARTGAQLYLSDEGTPDWKYAYAAESKAILLHDGDRFKVGNIRVEALHTPGHTPEHMVFVVSDGANSDLPIGVCTGDLLFVGDVGRPDLLEKAAGVVGSSVEGAHKLFHALQRLRSLPEFVQIWPGHGAGSVCGRALGAIPQSTLGYELRTNWGFSIADEERFVKEVLHGQPAPPPYFATMKRENKLGPAPLASLAQAERGSVQSLAEALADQLQVIDLRPAEQFLQGHIAGSINLPLNESFLSWAGWFTSADKAIGLIGEPQQQQEAIYLLRLIGSDRVVQLWDSTVIEQWPEALERISSYNPQENKQLNGYIPLDVRNLDEYQQGHIAGSLHIPLGELPKRLNELPQQELLVYCAGGGRAAIASSLLSAAGHSQISLLQGGIKAWQAAGLPVETH